MGGLKQGEGGARAKLLNFLFKNSKRSKFSLHTYYTVVNCQCGVLAVISSCHLDVGCHL